MDETKLQLHTPETLKAVGQRLAAQFLVLGKVEFREFETRIGYSYAPHGVLASPRAFEMTCPSRHAAYDYMRVYFDTGIFNVHCG